MNTSNTDSNVLALDARVRYTSNTRSIEPVFDRAPDPLRSTAMSVAFAEPVLDRPRPDLRLVPPVPAPARVRPRRPGPGVGPLAHPRRLRFVTPSPTRPRGCSAVAAPAPVRAWHLTERGVAVVMVLAAALVAASVVVVGLTALRVTGQSYAPGHSAAAPVVVER